MNASSNDRSHHLKDLLSEIDDELNIDTPSKARSETHAAHEIPLSETHTVVPLLEGLILYVDKERTEAILKYYPPSPPTPLTIKTIDLLERIKGLGYTYGLLEKNIQKALKVIKDNPNAEVDVVAALGRKPTTGHSTEIEYWIGNEEFVKKTGTVQVRKNDLLMRLSPPKPGIPGVRITGEKIDPPKVTQFEIQAGKRVRKTDEGEYFAECSGTVVFKNKVLSVAEINRDAEASVTVAEDGMQALLTIEPAMGKGNPTTPDRIKTLLTETRVWSGIHKPTIEKALYQANVNRQPVRNAVIAQGTPPSCGKDSWIEWHINPKMQRDRFVINEDGSIDFYNQNNILTVTEGDHLLTYHPATKGTNGMTVYGEPLPGKNGTSHPLEAGPNIHKHNEGTEWYAARTGLYRLHHNILEVQPMFYVKGDVDFSVGNIEFNGDIIIAGNVLDGFEVRAAGAISVQGTVEAAVLEAGKCVEVKNGIFGKEKGKITAGKNVVSFFLQNAEVRAGGDVIVGNQILNSRVYARNTIQVRCGKGSLVGGIAVAGFGIKAKTIGSGYGVRTVVEAGIDYRVLERMQYIGQKEKSLQSKSDQLEKIIEQERQESENSMFEDPDEELLNNALQRQEAIKNALTNLRAEYQTQAADLHVTENPEIIASEVIQPDVFVRIRDARHKFRTPAPKAKVGWDPQTGKIKLSTRGKSNHSSDSDS